MADTSNALADQINAQTQAMQAQMQHSQAEFFASQMNRSAEIDAMLSGHTPGMEPHGAPMMEGPMMEGQPMAMLDGQTPGLLVQTSLHQDDGDGSGVIESLLGFDLGGDEEDGVDGGQIHSLEDAVQLAQETGQVVVVEEVIVIEPGVDAHDASGGDFSF